MKYITEVEIDKPLDKVIELFDNPDHMSKWMEGLQSFESISGIPGQPGAKSRLKFKMGKRQFEMIETIITRNLPEEFSGTYDVNGIVNFVKNRFIKLTETRTKYITENELRLKGLMKFISLLMPGVFKKQSIKYLQAFKNFVESQN